MATAQQVEPRFTAATSHRIQSVDIVRGAAMILMAIDHIRDFVNHSAMAFSPSDLTRTTPAIFFTRWITHFCAPTFVFTAGIGAFLWLQRNRTKAQLSRFLLTRGLWLVFLELTVLRFILFIDPRIQPIILSVIWALGCSMIAVAALIHLPNRVLAPLSLMVIAGHNLLDRIPATRFGHFAWAWDILHQQGIFKVGTLLVLSAYPLIPYIFIMSAGYCFGPILLWNSDRRRRFLIRLGIALCAGFVVLRALNIYGDPFRWTHQPTALFTVLSFLNCTKYPPSLLFLLMTLGPAILLLGLVERLRLSDANPFIVFGRVPLFYYVVHLFVIHALTILMNLIRYGPTKLLFIPAPSLGGPPNLFPANYGWDLWVVYAVWITVLLILYPLCLWYSRLKQRRRDWWLSYL